MTHASSLKTVLQRLCRGPHAVAAAALTLTIAGAFLLEPSTARADTIWMCGHEIRTYITGDGYVLIGSVSGVSWENQRTDIVAWGQTAGGPLEPTPVLAVMYAGVKFAWMYSRVAINGHPDCNVVLH